MTNPTTSTCPPSKHKHADDGGTGPLESRFKGMICTVSPLIRRRAKIERLVIAYGGVVLGSKISKRPAQAPMLAATHHVLPDDEDRAGYSGALAVMTVDELLSHIDG